MEPAPDLGVVFDQHVAAEFVDMRHLLDQTTVRSALIAVSYVQEVREDQQK